MRRRQEWAKNPPEFVQTEEKPINEAKPPEATPRRRTVLAHESGVAIDLAERIVQQQERHEKLEESRPILRLPPKKLGRPPKNKQAP
jgi:hypothetical protein